MLVLAPELILHGKLHPDNNVKGFLTSADTPREWRTAPWYLLLASTYETFKNLFILSS